jgi:citrate synthase
MKSVEHPLLDHVGVFKTWVGAAFPGERAVFRGRDLHADLGDLSWLELAGLGILGRPWPKAQAQLMDAIWALTSYPDARIWNNRVAALAGSTRSTPNLAMSAAHAVSEATIYGRRNEYRALAFFLWVGRELDAGGALADVLARYEAERGKFPGYGRPLAMQDERIEPTMAHARALGLADGRHVSLAFEIERHFVAQGRPLRLNLGALVSAFGADFGFTPRQFNLLLFPAFLVGMQPCYLEALSKPAGAVFATPCAAVSYHGRGKRPWPRPGTAA